MKIMYVGCNPAGADDLLMDSEVTQLARLFRSTTGEPVDFLPHPRLPIEELPLVIAHETPDILHIAAHAADGKLLFANAVGSKVELNADGLAIYLKVHTPPRLVYLNACNSHSIAKAISSVVEISIGTTSAISNRTARAAAILFYDRILSGASVQEAFEAGRVTMATMQSEKLTSEIFAMSGVQTHQIRLYRLPCLVARFTDDKCKPNKKQQYYIEFGIAGCPSNTSQVVFFSDETSEMDICDICDVVRGTPVNNMFWNEESDDTVFGDFRAFATGTTTAGSSFTVASTVCNALETYYRLQGIERAQIPERARRAIEILRSKNGAKLPIGDAAGKNVKPKKKKLGAQKIAER